MPAAAVASRRWSSSNRPAALRRSGELRGRGRAVRRHPGFFGGDELELEPLDRQDPLALGEDLPRDLAHPRGLAENPRVRPLHSLEPARPVIGGAPQHRVARRFGGEKRRGGG